MDYFYPVDIRIDEDGRHVVNIRDLPECHTDGATRAEALTQAVDALEAALAVRITRKEEIPAASPRRGRPAVMPGARIAAKVALYQALAAAGVSRIELARRMGVDKTEVRRLLDPRHASSLDRLDQAVTALSHRLTIGLRAA